MLSHTVRDGDTAQVVKQALELRDRGRCRFVGMTGRRCDSRRFIGFRHVISRVNGGKGTAANLELRCGPHNRYQDDLEIDAIRRRLAEGPRTRSGTSAITGAGRASPAVTGS
jgi:hypothetical protein